MQRDGMLPCLSLRQPWAWAVVNWPYGDTPPKRTENREWNTCHRGRFLIHAAKGMTMPGYLSAVAWMLQRGLISHPASVPGPTQFQYGGIIGEANLVDVVLPHTVILPCRLAARPDLERWHMGDQYGFVLEDVQPLPFRPLRAFQRLFYVDARYGEPA